MDSIKTINNNKALKDGEQFVLKVTGYCARKAIADDYTSNSFYTSPGGYNVCIEVNPNGCGRGTGTHVSVYVNLLEGSYDATLSWPFVGTVTITLLNQLSDENHHTTTVEYKTIDNGHVGKSVGYSKFILHAALAHNPVKNTQYLMNDTLYFRVSVKETTHKPWLTCTDISKTY